jgi:hypothetical protein
MFSTLRSIHPAADESATYFEEPRPPDGVGETRALVNVPGETVPWPLVTCGHHGIAVLVVSTFRYSATGRPRRDLTALLARSLTLASS